MEDVRERMVSEKLNGLSLNDVVGGGDPGFVIQNTRDILLRHGNIREGIRVFEIGCGCGRAALAVYPELSKGGYYLGVDMIPNLIDFARREISSRSENFEFYAVSVNNPLYDNYIKPDFEHLYIGGELSQKNGSFDLVMAFSVFTHLSIGEARKMLREVWERLDINGYAVLSFFIIDASAREAIEKGRTDRFKSAKSSVIGDVVLDNDGGQNSAVGYDIQFLSEMVKDAGFLGIYGLQFGFWRCAPGETYQDVLILKKVPPIPDEFNAEIYMEMNPDLKDAGVNAHSHFFNWGQHEGRPWKAG